MQCDERGDRQTGILTQCSYFYRRTLTSVRTVLAMPALHARGSLTACSLERDEKVRTKVQEHRSEWVESAFSHVEPMQVVAGPDFVAQQH